MFFSIRVHKQVPIASRYYLQCCIESTTNHLRLDNIRWESVSTDRPNGKQFHELVDYCSEFNDKKPYIHGKILHTSVDVTLAGVFRSLERMDEPLLDAGIREDQSIEADNLHARINASGKLPIYNVIFGFLNKVFKTVLGMGSGRDYYEVAHTAAIRMTITFRYALTHTIPDISERYVKHGNLHLNFDIYDKLNTHYYMYICFYIIDQFKDWTKKLTESFI